MAVWPLPRITFRALNSVQEKRRVALLTPEAVWQVLGTHLALPVVIQAEPERYERDLFDYLADHLPSTVEVVYAVGSGAPVEAAKVVASRNDVPLVIVPTALDSLHMLAPYAMADEPVEDRKRRVRIETGPATEIILDWDIIQAGPEHRRGAGIVDVLSIVTGLLDWRYAAQKGKNPRRERFRPWAAGVATDLAKQAIKSAAAIGQGDRDALTTLLDLMMIAVQLNNEMKHTRVQEGSEHFLADMLAATTNPQTAHAELVGPCLLFAAALHGQDPTPLREAMVNAKVRLDQVRATDFNLLLDNLPTHLADHAFPFSMLNDLDPVAAPVAQALEAAGLAILPETWEMPEDTGLYDATLEEVVAAAVAAGDATPEDTRPDTGTEETAETEAAVAGVEEAEAAAETQPTTEDDEPAHVSGPGSVSTTNEATGDDETGEPDHTRPADDTPHLPAD